MPPDLCALRAQLAAALATLDAMEPTDAADPWLDLDGATAAVPVPRDTLARWAREGRLRAVTAERGRLLFRRSWLDTAIEAAPYRPRSAEPADDGGELPAGLRLIGGRG